MDNTDDWRRVGDVVALGFDRVLAPVEAIHLAIADSWFALGGRRLEPIRRSSTTWIGGTYAAIRSTGHALATAGGATAAVAARRGIVAPPSASPIGTGVEAFGTALWGDALDRRETRAESGPTVRGADGRTIPIDRLADAFTNPTGRLVVLLHGLGETERTWRGRLAADGSAVGLADRLIAAGLTPVMVRYNTGRSIARNGRDVATLIEGLVAAWPIPIREISLVGYSVGGLVARRTVIEAARSDAAWVSTVRHLVTLGSPHLGSPIEKGAEILGRTLAITPVTRSLGDFLDGRSIGIKNLRHGDVDAHLDDVSDIAHHFLGSTVTGSTTGVLGRIIGDLVVRTASSTASGRKIQIPATDVVVLGGLHHLRLPREPAVHQQILDWIASPATPDHPPRHTGSTHDRSDHPA